MCESICCLLDKAEDEETNNFAGYVSDVLDMPLTMHPLQSAKCWTDRAWIKNAVDDSVLVLLHEPTVPIQRRWRFDQLTNWLVGQIPTNILVVRQPRWPFRHILLLVRNDKTDERAAAWVLRLASVSGASVTILPILPPLPNFLPVSDDMQAIRADILGANTPLGVLLRRLQQELDLLHIMHSLWLLRGTADWQMAQALDMGHHELIVVGAESRGWVGRWVIGELIPPLLRWLDRPLLIVKSQEDNRKLYG